MAKHKLRIYVVFILAATAGLVFCCLCPALGIIDTLKTDFQNLDNYEIFMNVMSLHSNYLSVVNVTVFFTLAYILGLNSLLGSNNPYLILRHKSRKSYTVRQILDALQLAAVFVFLIETVNICFSFVIFGKEMTLKTNLILYSLLDYLTMAVYFWRAGIVLVIMRAIVNDKAAPILSFAVYMLEYSASELSNMFKEIWLPFADSISVNYLLSGAMMPTDIIPVMLRAIIMNGGLILVSFFIFDKKDIIAHEKR